LTETADASEHAETRTAHATSAPETEQGALLGTFAYMSPEQAEGKKVDARSDIFSFGSLLYEMVTGHLPFRAGSKMALLAAIINQDPKPLPPDTQRELERLVSRCLRKDLSRRTQHIGDVKLALEDLKEESESRQLAIASTPVRRTMPRWAALALVAAVAIAAAGWFWLQGPATSSSGEAPVTTPLT
ncbi:MAG: protein kinase, partial [bacterium]|nr:protein kinase [bacterium]